MTVLRRLRRHQQHLPPLPALQLSDPEEKQRLQQRHERVIKKLVDAERRTETSSQS